MKETKVFLTDQEDRILEEVSDEYGQSKTKFCTTQIRKILKKLKS